MGRSVLAHGIGIVCQHPHSAQLHECGQAHSVLQVIGENHKGAGVGEKSTMDGHAVHDCAHAELAHAIGDVIAFIGFGIQRNGYRRLCAYRSGQVSRTTEHLGEDRNEAFEHLVGTFAGGQILAISHEGSDDFSGFITEAFREFSGHAAAEFGSFSGKILRIGLKISLPFALGLGTGSAGIPCVIDILGNHKGRLCPSERLLGFSSGLCAQRRPVNLCRVSSARAVSDMRFADDETRFLGVGAGRGQGLIQLLLIMAVNGTDNLPAVGLITGPHIFGEPAIRLAIDGNAVAVIQGDELAQFPDAGQRAGFMAYDRR